MEKHYGKRVHVKDMEQKVPIFSGDFPITMRHGEKYRFSLGHPLRWLSGIPHEGVDWAMPSRTELYAPTETKTVALTNTGKRGYGLSLLLESIDGDYRFLYAHLTNAIKSSIFQGGELVALSGGDKHSPTSGNSTGSHLHFEVRKKIQGGWLTVDPLKYFALQAPGSINVKKLFKQIWGVAPARGDELYFIKRVEIGTIKNDLEDMKNKMKFWRDIVYPDGMMSLSGNVKWQREKAKILLGY